MEVSGYQGLDAPLAGDEVFYVVVDPEGTPLPRVATPDDMHTYVINKLVLVGSVGSAVGNPSVTLLITYDVDGQQMIRQTSLESFVTDLIALFDARYVQI